MNEIYSIGAYVPYTLLPAYIQSLIAHELPYKHDDIVTTCYMLKSSAMGADYVLHVDVAWSSSQQSKSAYIELAGLTESERVFIDTMLSLRVLEGLKHFK